MSGGCALEGCSRPVESGRVLCRWHACQTPPALYARLMEAWTTMHRAKWGIGLFNGSTPCSREAAEQAYRDAAAEVRQWWAGSLVE